MPRPNKGESREDFLHRYMADGEARKDHPDEKQRFAIAASLWEGRNELEEAANSLGYNAEKEGAEPFAGRHIQPGVVAYPEMQHPVTGKQGIAVLVEKDVLDQMRATFRGIPVINWKHDFSGGAEKWIKDGKAVGVATMSKWDGESGWEGCEYFLWDREAKANARNGFRLSNAWRAEDVDWTPGTHNGVAYDGRLKAARYTHLALVTNPRYEGAETYANAKDAAPGGSLMFKLFGFGKKESVELAKDSVVKIGGKDVPMLEVANAAAHIEAERAKSVKVASSEIGDQDEVEVNGKKYKGIEVANALAAMAKAAEKKEDAPEPEAPGLPKTQEEFANALKAEREAALTAMAEKIDGLKGDALFEAVNQIIEKGKQKPEAAAPVKHLGQKARVARGSEKYGKREVAK